MSWLGSIFGSIPTTADNPQDDSTLAPPSLPQSSQPPVDNTVKVAILLDGDADYFTQAYTSKGYRGGRSASLDLRNKVHHYILSRTTSSSKSTQIEIIAFSFLNLSGLSNFLGEDLKSFTQGFNSSPYAFSMSDVGNLPQAADEAIKSHLPFLLSTCNHILLGGTHDGGYSQTLLRLDPLVLREKVVLLRTHSFCAERILELGLEEVRFEGLFEGRDPTMRSRNTKPSYTNGSQISSSSSPFKSTQPRSQSPSKPSLPSTSTPSLPKPFPAPSLSDRLAPSPFPISPTPSTSTSSSPTPDFGPLLQTLQYFSTSRKDPQPRSSDIGNNLRKRWPRALDQTGGSFGEYVRLADEKGLIRLGRGERMGSEWIELITGKEKEKEKEKGYPPHLVDPTTTTTINSKKEPLDFVPLVTLLLNSPQPRPLRALIGERLARLQEGERPFEARAGEFRMYYEAAVERGLVRVGRGDVMGAEWIELGMSEAEAREYIKTHSRASTVYAPSVSSTPTPALSSTLSSASLAPYLPLLEVLLLQPSSRPEWTPIAGFIATYKPRPYSSEPGSFKRYIEGAKSLGLIETGQVRGKEYNFWMELRMGKEEAKELLEREKERGGMRHQSTGFTKVILSPLASASNSYLASEKVESRFQPLVNALEELRKGGNFRPEWTVIGTVLGNLRPRPYPNEPGALKRYVEEAEKEGLVSTGRVEGKEFGYWMKLNINSQDTKPVSAPSIKPTTSTQVPTRFQPLIQAIRDSPFDQPYCSQIAYTLSKLKPRAPFVQGGWRDYLSDAEKEGVVKTGVKGQGQEWVEITEGFTQTSTSTSAKSESKPSLPTNSSIVVLPTSPPSHSSTPSISSVSSLAVSTPMTVTRSSPTIPSALLQHWQSLYSLHPFSPLILTLDFIESSTSTPSPSAETLKTYLGLLPDGLEGVLRRARGDGVLGGGEGFEEYVAKAMKRGVVVVDQDGGRLADEWKGWKGR